MPMTPKKMIKLLESNGFQYLRANGSHKIYKNPKTNRTVTVPMHNQDLKKGTEQKILKDAGLK